MRDVVFKSWKFEVDSELTRKAHEKELKGSSDDCICEYCENYRLQRENIFPEEVKVLFENLGIDFKKESEISEYGELETGLHKYLGWFHFAGKIINGEDCKKLIGENSWQINLVEITDNFKIGFTTGNSLSFFEKGINLVQVEFETDLPWIMKDAEDMLDLRAAQKDEANAPTISLSDVEKEFGIQ